MELNAKNLGKVEFAVEIKYSSHRAANLPMED
jgi:hypothetical protein